MSLKQAFSIASLFDLPGNIEVFDFPQKGNINRETYLVTAGSPSHRDAYILQRLNPSVFKRPSDVMRAMIACIEAQRKAVSEGALRNDEEWETIRLIPAKDGKPFLEIIGDDSSSCWRMMARIAQSRSYKSLREIEGSGARMRAAEEAGHALALFGTLVAGMNPLQIECPLPGYRNTDLYYDQLLSILAGNRTPEDARSCLPTDPELRHSTGEFFLVRAPEREYRRRMEDPAIRKCIEIALEQKPLALKLALGLKTGELKTAVIHGDTKLDNFLFSTSTGRAKALIDLDTIMPHTWLSDWGDMARSLINPAGERETDVASVSMDLEVFTSAARGFLGAARHVADHEIALMADAVQAMSLELGARFLADYLRGDTYFRLGPEDPPDLNKTRAVVQFRLFESVRAKQDRIQDIISECRKRGICYF